MGFALESADVVDGRVVLTGRWSGVRGMRFVRPTLVLRDREVLATLEHKPWAVLPDAAWVAAFPWPAGERLDLTTAQLAVAPNITVPLDPDAPPPVLDDPEPAARAGRLQREVDFLQGRREDELAAARQRIGAVEDARDAVREQLEAAEARAVAAEARAADLGEQLARAEAELAVLRSRPDPAATQAFDALEAEVSHTDVVPDPPVRDTPTVRPRPRLRNEPQPTEAFDPIAEGAVLDPVPAPVVAPPARRTPARAPRGFAGLDLWAQRVLALAAALSLVLLVLGLVRVL